jgi:acetylglutamate kinase
MSSSSPLPSSSSSLSSSSLSSSSLSSSSLSSSSLSSSSLSSSSGSAAAVPLALVKVGGEVVEDDAHRRGLARNVRALVDRGFHVVVVHGGGPQVTALQARLGHKAVKVAGQRVTGVDDLAAVVATLAGTVNVTLCAALLQEGVRAFGCHGASAAVVQARHRPPVEVAGHGVVDYGEVGDVVAVDATLLRALCGLGLVPVVATLGVEPAGGRILNVNGDAAAAAAAAALQAQLLFLVTAIGAVRRVVDDPASRLPRLGRAAAGALLADGTIGGGMIPKVEEALALLDRGVGQVAILDARDDDAFASVARGDDARGTVLQP